MFRSSYKPTLRHQNLEMLAPHRISKAGLDRKKAPQGPAAGGATPVPLYQCIRAGVLAWCSSPFHTVCSPKIHYLIAMPKTIQFFSAT